MASLKGFTRRQALRLIGAGSAGLAAAPLINAAPLMITGATQSSFPGMPGRFPGRVVAIEDSKSVVGGKFQDTAVTLMVREGMMRLTGEKDLKRAWQTLFQSGDVVGIKWNPNGRDDLISSRPVLEAILYGLDLAGVRMTDVIVFERYQEILDRMIPWMPRWLKRESASQSWDRVQQNIANYDPQVFAELPIVLAEQRDDNPAVRRSHVAQFASKHVSKIINVAVLKHHNAGGVTLSLKNITYGMANNVNRSHENGQHVCRIHELLPALADLPPIRGKVVLNIVDGLNALYNGGPYGKAQFIWPHQRIYFSTDPVAMDRIGWKIIDEKRAASGLKPVAQATPEDPNGVVARPDHIVIAGQKFGLGEWRPEKIDFKVTRTG
jgi:hypothetical protein